MIVELIIGQMLLICFNVGNAHYDAYRILNHKTIAHSINFVLYFAYSIALCWIFRINFKFFLLFNIIPIAYGPGLLFLVTAFLNRQFSFDIPLNLRRGLDWYYQTKATGKKASVLDRIERFFAGSGENAGIIIFSFYLGAYAASIVSFIIAYG